jgi:hypothetical protein
LTDKSARVRGGNQRSVARKSGDWFKLYEMMHYFMGMARVYRCAPSGLHLFSKALIAYFNTSFLFASIY